jgi:hypothetical protein
MTNPNIVDSPWGKVQHQEDLAEGIAIVSTAGHGGVWLSARRLEELEKKLGHVHIEGRWFEEDCDWAVVAIVFPEAFSDENRKAAPAVIREWRPELVSYLIERGL